MTIHLPDELERSVREAVEHGRFESVDDALAEAVRLLLREIGSEGRSLGRSDPSPFGSIGALHDDADLLDQAVEHAMKVREDAPWRLSELE